MECDRSRSDVQSLHERFQRLGNPMHLQAVGARFVGIVQEELKLKASEIYTGENLLATDGSLVIKGRARIWLASCLEASLGME
mmetsp:Transcript_72887/g.194583  ORF Transcript_72887/g.194583 Transcript_72887/m.194583 type:complete len:83 (+) Transcript_72887:319-567(+)